MTELAAGRISAVLAGAALRDIEVAGHPALDAVYVTVRDAAWRTVPGRVVSSRAFTTQAAEIVQLEVRHRLGEIDFWWRGTAEMTRDRLRFTFEGRAESDFDANRIGLCLLHPQALRGRAVRVSGPDGEQQSRFPVQISPYQPFFNVQRMTCDVADGAELEIGLAGGLFEVEDHRNWSDPGWKTYCPPLAAPRPVRRAAGEQVKQAVELIARVTAGGAGRRRAVGASRLALGPRLAGTMPMIGLGASGLPGLDEVALSRIRSLRPAYLHVELEKAGDWEQVARLAVAEAAALSIPLNVALIAEPADLAAMAARACRLSSQAGGRLSRVSAYSPVRHTTDDRAVAALHAGLAAAPWHADVPAAVGGGSRASLAELNRGTFRVADWDFVTYGLTPQVHHHDDQSILSTIAAVADGLQRAAAIAAGRPVVVGPVTLRPRFNPDLGRPDPMPPALSGPDLDDRQSTGLAAVYLAGALSRLAGAHAVTAYRTAGPRGVLAANGTLRPAAEVIRVFAALGGAAIRVLSCEDPELVTLAATGPAGLTMIIVNLSQRPHAFELPGAELRVLNVLGTGPLDPNDRVLPACSVTVIEAVAADEIPPKGAT